MRQGLYSIKCFKESSDKNKLEHIKGVNPMLMVSMDSHLLYWFIYELDLQ